MLRQYAPAAEVWAFGSRARRCAKPYSDLDLMLVEEKPLSFSAMAELKEAFSESRLPYKVDVLEWASTEPGFRRIVEREKVVVLRAA